MDFTENNFLGKILKADESSPEHSKECSMPVGEFPSKTPIGMAYVPFQQWEKPYDREAALSRGTIFPALDKPFIGEEAVRRGSFR